MASLLTNDELVDIEKRHQAEGVSVRQVVELFQQRGIRLSEATFRKYVQVGLLPRSRRVGRKGKHRGSRGVYPATVIRRVNAIKAMMAEGMTLEEIRGSFLFLRGELDVAEESLGSIGEELARALGAAQLEGPQRGRLEAELKGVKEDSARLTARMERLASRIVAARDAGREPNRVGVGK